MTTYNNCLAWACSAILWSGSASAQAPARPRGEAIGPWILSCPAAERDPCAMRHRDWVLPPVAGGPSIALEVQARGAEVVPVVTVRGLSAALATAGTLVMKPLVELMFESSPPIGLTCGVSGDYVACAPDVSAIAAAARLLRIAPAVTVTVSLPLGGASALSPRGASLDLAGTNAALTRLRVLGVTAEAVPAYPGLDLRGLADRLSRAAGFPDGVTGVVPRLGPTHGR